MENYYKDYYKNMFGKVNRIIICKDEYPTKEDFENAIKEAVMCLLSNNYLMTIKYDDKEYGIVCIDYNYDDEGYGCAMPYWLLPEEFDCVEWVTK